jgi:hypothetical protein
MKEVWVFEATLIMDIELRKCTRKLIYLGKWYFVTKIVLTYCEKKCSSDREKI